MRIIDISVPVRDDMPVWPGDPPAHIDRAKAIAKGDPCNVSRLSLGAHTGTHVDAPYHFIEKGRRMEGIPLDVLMGPCRVIEAAPGPLIERKDLERYGIEPRGRVLFKTANSALWRSHPAEFRKNFTALSPGAAAFLAEREALLVGIDYLSIESFHAEGGLVHRTLLGKNIVILEGLDLSCATPGNWELICLPLSIPGAEGAPARAILREL
ncbi:MAG: cyclase family protein [Chrysiogenales bacterium]|nr:MAG: cyclase family protein [Chrysiogenales bacterium]